MSYPLFVGASLSNSSQEVGMGKLRLYDTANGAFGSLLINDSAVQFRDTAGNLIAIGGGSGDMLLGTSQTVTGAKTFNNATLLLRNVANTFSAQFTNTNTAARTYTLPDASGTVALTSNITLAVREIDGTPSIAATTIEFSNGHVTDMGGGVARVSITGHGGGGSTPVDITVANEATDTTCFVAFFTAATGDLGPKTNGSLTYNSATSSLACTTFVGALTGVASGNALASHTHGNITNAGAIGATSGLPVITTTSGVLTTGTLTGTGTVLVAATSPTLVTPILGSGTYTLLRQAGSEPSVTPTGTTATIDLNAGNMQTIGLGSASGNVTLTLTIPTGTGSAIGSILANQGATPRNLTIVASDSSTIRFFDTKQDTSTDAANTTRGYHWRWNGSNLYIGQTAATTT